MPAKVTIRDTMLITRYGRALAEANDECYRLLTLNAELVAALADLVADSAPDREGCPAHDRARALIAKARDAG